MLPRAARITLSLRAGATLTLAVAWAFAIFSPRPAQSLNNRPAAWLVPVPDHWTPPESDMAAHATGISPHTTTARSAVPLRAWPGWTHKRYSADADAVGWTSRALYCEDQHNRVSRRYQWILNLRPGFPGDGYVEEVPLDAEPWPVPPWIERRLHAQSSTDAAGNAQRIPATSTPRGFILNTLLYAACVYALFSLVLLIRSARRRAKHHCPACNYSLAGLPPHSPCPECGLLPSSSNRVKSPA